MTLPHTLAVVAEETANATDAIPANGFHLEPRCRVCRSEEVRTKVNDMLSTGASFAYIVRALEGDNAELGKRDRVTIDSIRNHSSRHYPVQNVARAIYRDILERRAKENGIDFVDGVATALTPMAFYEIAMNKAFRSLDRTEVSVETGLRAAEKLQSVLDTQDKGSDLADVIVKVQTIIGAVKSTVPPEMWGEIVDKLEELEQHYPEARDVGTDSFDDADEDPFDPTEFIDEDDEF